MEYLSSSPPFQPVLVFGSEVSLPLQHIYGSCFCISSFTTSLNVVFVVQSLSRVCHRLQYARLSFSSLSPRVCSNSCPLSQWWHPTISSSVIPVSSCPQCFPASWSFPVSWLFALTGQSIGASASVSMNIQGWFPLGLTGLISLQSNGLSRVFPIP